SLIIAMGWTVLASLKTDAEFAASSLAFPREWKFSNYIKAFDLLAVNDTNLVEMLFNSLWLAVLTPSINLFTAAMASYIMAKYKFPGRNLIWGIMVTLMVIPIYGATASRYQMYKFLGIYNSPLLLVTAICGIGGNMMLIATFEGVSTTYMEAAFIDGAGHFRIFFTIMLPQVTGLISALWIMSFISTWNDYMTSIMFLPDYLTLATGLYRFRNQTQSRGKNIPVLFAGVVLCMIPAITLFSAFQDKFLNLNFGGGIKG
ncbi:MAG: carbohydrate ABC transporter permease, partial [Candidatus Scatosoma sp.]